MKNSTKVSRTQRPKDQRTNQHFVIILSLMVILTVFYYLDAIVDYWNLSGLRWGIFYTVHDLHRILFCIPVLYAAWFFRLKGVLFISPALFLIFLPRAILFSPYPDPVLRMLIFFISITVLAVLLAVFLNVQSSRKKLQTSLLQAQNDLLRQTRDYLEVILGNSSMPILSMDKNRRVTYFNPAFEDLTGLKANEITGRGIENLFPEGQTPDTLNRIIQPSEKENWATCEVVISNKAGTAKTTLWSMFNIYDRDSNTALDTIVLCQDISERKLFEKKISEETAWRRVLMDQSHDGIVVLDNDGNVFETNQEFARLLGYSPDELRRLHVWDWEIMLSREKILELLRSVDEKGAHFETRQRGKDGSEYDTEISANGANIAGRRLIFCVCRNITARKQAEEKLRQSESKYTSLVEQSNDAIIVVENGILRFANQRTSELTGFTPEEVLDRSFVQFLPPAEAERRMEQHLQRMAGRDVPAIFETSILTRSGHFIPVEINSRLTVFQGRPAVLALVRDITERKLIESKTIEMEALKRINQAKSELLANVSHELRTPLASIKGYIETLLETDIRWTNEQQREILRSADMETDRLSWLIRDLLDMARIDSGKLVLDRRVHSLQDILNSVSGVLEIVAEKHKLRIQADKPELVLHLDKARICQVISNLVENAVKFSGEGTPILLEIKSLNGNTIFSVEDRGIGIPEQAMPHIFDRFYQAREVVAGKTHGTGLGLAICKGIVESHGGRIWFESQPGKGSKFIFSLPAN